MNILTNSQAYVKGICQDRNMGVVIAEFEGASLRLHSHLGVFTPDARRYCSLQYAGGVI